MDKQSTSRHAKSVKGITEELPEEEPKLAGQRAAVCVCVYLSATQRGGERKGKKTLRRISAQEICNHIYDPRIAESPS